MSKSRIIASFTAVSSAALVAVFAAVWFFPLHSQAQSVMDSPGITVDPGGTLMHRAPVVYFGSATGTVMLEASLNQKGEVADARVLSGPDELRNPALQSVLKWHYSPEAGRSVEISIKFDAVQPSVRPATPPIDSGLHATIKTIQILGASPELEQQVRSALPVREGDSADANTMNRVLAAAQGVDEHFTGIMDVNGNHEAAVTLRLPPAVTRNVAPEGVILPPSRNYTGLVPPPPPENVARIRVGGNVQQANLITRVVPVYPPEAKQARVQGVVHLAVTISKGGTVQGIKVISGDQLLVPAALQAVAQWVYRPTLLNGAPVEVSTQVDVNFTLAK